MKLGRTLLGAAALLACILSTRAVAQEPLRTHRDLDWQAPLRWVHVDNLDPAKAALFVGARHGWLETLRRDGELLGDGRALFWHARTSPHGETFFSFYPFATWSDLEARKQMAARTNEVVGEDAGKAYDSGDEALVSPHYSQIWSRATAFDIAGSGAEPMTELTAMAGRLEVHSVDITQWDIFEQSWKELTEALTAAHYPLACRAFRSAYGNGEYMVWWLASDSTSYRNAPSVEAVLDRRLGPEESGRVREALERVFPLEESYEVARRPDMCNLGR